MKISVLTPSYNAADSIEKAIVSVMHQHYVDFEHIIADGGSTDKTVDILKKYSHIRWISEPDKGQSDAMNKAFNMADGDLIVYLNADDWFYEDTFEKVVQYFNDHPDTMFLTGNLDIYRTTDHSVKNTKPTIEIKDIFDYRKFRFPLNPVSYFYRREVQERVGIFPVENHYAMDYWFLLRAYHLFAIDHLDQPFGCFLMGSHNKSQRNSLAEVYAPLHATLTEFLLEIKSVYYLKESWEVLRDHFQSKIKRKVYVPLVKLKNKISPVRAHAK